MNAADAHELGVALKRWNIPGAVAPEDPGNPEGEWRVYDGPDPETRSDITADALAELAKCEKHTDSAPAKRIAPGPTRGFVIPSDM